MGFLKVHVIIIGPFLQLLLNDIIKVGLDKLMLIFNLLT